MQISTLNAQIDINDQELDLTKQELERFRALMAKGLAAANGESNFLRGLLASQSRREQLSSDLAQAETKLKDIDLAAEHAQSLQRYGLLTELEQTKRQIADLKERITAMQQPRTDAKGDSQTAAVEFVILRPKGEELELISADELSKIEGGDLIKVRWRVTLPAAGAAPAPAATSDTGQPADRSF